MMQMMMMLQKLDLVTAETIETVETMVEVEVERRRRRRRAKIKTANSDPLTTLYDYATTFKTHQNSRQRNAVSGTNAGAATT